MGYIKDGANIFLTKNDDLFIIGSCDKQEQENGFIVSYTFDLTKGDYVETGRTPIV